MTNAEIIYNAKIQLAKDGKLTIDASGEIEEIHTYDHWKKLGYQVLKGEKAICKLNIWKPISKKKAQKEQEEAGEEKEEKKEPAPWMMPKTAFFFSRSQVDKIA